MEYKDMCRPRYYIVQPRDEDVCEKRKWKIINDCLFEIKILDKTPEFIKGLKLGLYYMQNPGGQWRSGNGSVFAEETRKRLGLNQHQYNLCCEAIIHHKYNEKYDDLWLQKKTRDKIIKDLVNSHFLQYKEISNILDYYDKYR